MPKGSEARKLEPAEKRSKPPRIHAAEVVDVSTLKPHPKNYRSHPEEQLLHLGESMRQHGVYKNIVVTRDGTILAGHGIFQAAQKVGLSRMSVVRLNIDPKSPQALKIVAADNELPRFSENDDRQLTELLQQIMKEDPAGLVGTGYTEQSLAALLMTTRPASEIAGMDETAEWVGMPEYDPGEAQYKLIISFKSEADRAKFTKGAKLLGVTYKGATWSARWPPDVREDVAGVRFASKK
jgi:ParB-like nuclease domain